MNVCVNVSLHMLIGCLQHHLRKRVNQKLFHLTFELNEKSLQTLIILISKAKHLHFVSDFIFLPASHCFYYCPSNLSCMFESQIELNISYCHSANIMETSFLITQEWGCMWNSYEVLSII